MLTLKTASLFVVAAFIASFTAPCNGFSRHRSESCPSEWFSTQFSALMDTVAPLTTPFSILDTNLTFFRNILLFSEEEIERVTQHAIKFFDTRFGLDFSQSTPNAQGQRILGNAVLSPSFVSPEFPYFINIDLLCRSKNLCFDNREGGYAVRFTGEETLHGMYGGQDGLSITRGDVLLYGFYRIQGFQYPIIHFNTGTPVRLEPVDRFRVLNYELQHPRLGAGVAQGVFRVVPTGEPGMFRFSIRLTFTFPAHPGLN